MFSTSQEKKIVQTIQTYTFTSVHIQEIIQNLIKTLEVTIYNTKHTGNTLNIFPTIHYSKIYISVGLLGLSRQLAHIKKDARCDYTNVTCP